MNNAENTKNPAAWSYGIYKDGERLNSQVTGQVGAIGGTASWDSDQEWLSYSNKTAGQICGRLQAADNQGNYTIEREQVIEPQVSALAA